MQNKRNEPFEFRNAQEIMKKIGLDASLQDCALLAEKAVGYLWWKNIHDPSVAQVMDVLLKGMESPGSGKTLIEKIANSIDLQGSLLATKTIDEMHEIYQKQSSRSNLVAYFKNVNYRIDDYVVDSGMRLMQLLGEIVYSGDYITVHPELGIVRTGNDGLILDQHVGNRVGGSYDLKMYTSNPFVKVMPYLGK